MPPSPAPKNLLIGCACAPIEEQITGVQIYDLRVAGCGVAHQEHGSGASRARPVRSRLPERSALTAVRIDRLARSACHLLEEIEGLAKMGAHFRSLTDPIDTSTPQGMFSLQDLGEVTQVERTLISERTKADLRAAKARGQALGSPGTR
nr:recombinase family protein [Microvirga roseola]